MNRCRSSAGPVGLVIAALLAVGSGDAAAQSVPKARVAELIAQAKQQVQSGAPTPAQSTGLTRPRPVVDLSLDRALELAAEHNLDISVERINPQLQELTVAQVRTAFVPSVNSTLGQRSQSRLPTSQLNGGQQVLNETTTYNGGVSQSSPWFGGSASLTFNNSKLVTTDAYTLFSPQFTSTLTAAYTQPLLRNFRIDSTRQQLATARISREVSDIQLRAVVTTTLSSVRSAYWDFLYAVQAAEAARRSLALAQKLVEDNRVKVEVGAMAKIDIVQAEAEAANRRQTVAQSEATQRNTELTLKRLIVSGTDDPLWGVALNPVDRPTFNPEPIDLEAVVTRALEVRTDLVQARRQIESNGVTVRYLRNQLLPQFDLTASYGVQGLGGTRYERKGLGGAVSATFPGSYKDALTNLQNRDYPLWNLMLNFSYPIGRSSNQTQYARAKLQVAQAQAQLKALELQVATEVTSAALAIESNLKRVEAATAARELAQRRLEAEQSKFEVGMSTNFFVVQAQRDLFDSQRDELRATLDYRKSLVDLERVQEVGSTRSTISAVSAGSGARGGSSGSSGGF